MIKKQSLSIDLRILVVLLLLIIASMLVIWRPWSARGTTRTIAVTGESTVETKPDEFQFYPTYQKKSNDRAAAQAELTTLINSVITKLKELGVNEDDISLQSSAYDNYWNEDNAIVNSNSLTITVDNKDLAQKVQDYLITTSPMGQISPVPVLKDETRKAAETDARTKAIDDARQKAERTASELGGKLGKVVTITDQNSGPYPMPMRGMAVANDSAMSVSTLPVMPGTQDVYYTVQVTYELR